MAELAALCRPRYHFAGSRNVFYARPPYMNPDLGAGAHATRFIGLASVGNMTKQKSLHALGLVPAASMDIGTLQQKPEVCTTLLQWEPSAFLVCSGPTCTTGGTVKPPESGFSMNKPDSARQSTCGRSSLTG